MNEKDDVTPLPVEDRFELPRTATAEVIVPQSIPLKPVEDWVDDENRAFYGRYRLWFLQVSPSPECGSVLVPVKDGRSPNPEALAGPPRTNWPITLATAKDMESIGRSGGAGLWFELTSPCYIDMRNLHRAVTMLAPDLEDAHLFTYSSGDNDDQWVDEIRIVDGAAVMDRWTVEPSAYEGLLPFCERLLHLRDYDVVFRRFVSYLHFVGKVPSRAWEPIESVMFSPQRPDERQLAKSAQEVAALDPVRRDSALRHLARALEIDPENYLARDLLERL